MQQSGALTGLVGLLRGVALPGREGSSSASDAQLNTALQSIAVQLTGKETVVTANIPTALLTRFVSTP